MTQEEYKAAQRDSIEKALAAGRELLQTSAGLHEVCDTADTGATRNDETKNYMRDTLMYFDFSDAAASISGMPDRLNELAQTLVEIKVANDRMLPRGGFIPKVDGAIAEFFLAHDLFKARTIDADVLAAIREAVAMLEQLQQIL